MSDEFKERVKKLGDIKEDLLRNSYHEGKLDFSQSMRSGKKFQSESKLNMAPISAKKVDMEGRNTIEESEVQDDSDQETKKSNLKENLDIIKYSQNQRTLTLNSNYGDIDTEGESVLIGDEDLMQSKKQGNQSDRVSTM